MSTNDADVLLALAVRVAEGDRVAFAAIYEAMSPHVLAAVAATGIDPAVADAVVVSTFVELWQLARFHTAEGADVAEWLRQIVQRRCHERTYGVRASDWNAADEQKPWWIAATENYDLSAQVVLTDLLRQAKADRESLSG